ncbi:MAG: hypothetical protein LBP92_11735 [Deltaproteobacteria bacterium]|nr:hypothetical protein [Deltaproteobacteria bacterium]
MIFALFGVTCVGKTTIGQIVSEILCYDFYDLDIELKLYFNDTIENIQDSCFNRFEYDNKKVKALKNVVKKCNKNTIIAMSPIYYASKYKSLFKINNILSIELQDTPENIAKRIIYTDENDNLIENIESDLQRDIDDIKYYITHYKKAFSNIEHKYQINGKSALEAAREVVDIINRCSGLQPVM